MAGNFFVIKAVGAAAEAGAGLAELVALGERVNSVTRTMGMALTSCTPPAKGSPLFELGDDEMEMGVGIHGEPGRSREKLAGANEIVDALVEAVVTDLPYGRGDKVALMINGLGGTPISELYLLYGRAHDQLQARGIEIARSYVGEYCTSLDMAGCSVTLVRLDDELVSLLDRARGSRHQNLLMRLAPFASRYTADAIDARDRPSRHRGGRQPFYTRAGARRTPPWAASAVLAVTNQHMCGMGGDLFALVQEDGTAPVALNTSGRAGSGRQDPDRLRGEGHSFMPRTGDIRCVPVPGCVDGWLALHSRYGRLPLARVLEAAMVYADEGFPTSHRSPGRPSRCKRFLAARTSLPRPTLVPSSGVPGWLGPCGQLPRADGPAFTEASSARASFAWERVSMSGPTWPRPSADWVEPLSVEAFGSRIWTTPPNSQGYLTLAAAWIADGLGLPDDTDDPLWAHLSVEAACQAAYDRTDVLHEHADGARLLAPERLAARRAAILPEAASLLPGSYGAGDTIYLCAVDRDRMGVSLIQSNAGSFGSGLPTSTGIFLQNRGVGFSLKPGHPAEYGPGRRPPHTLSPALSHHPTTASKPCSAPWEATPSHRSSCSCSAGSFTRARLSARRWGTTLGPVQRLGPRRLSDVVRRP